MGAALFKATRLPPRRQHCVASQTSPATTHMLNSFPNGIRAGLPLDRRTPSGLAFAVLVRRTKNVQVCEPSGDRGTGTSIHLSQERHLVIHQTGIRSLVLDECPQLEIVDLSLLQGEVHVAVRGCPRLQRIFLPSPDAGGAALVHLEVGHQAYRHIKVEGAVRQFDVCLEDGRQLQQHSGRFPWSAVILVSGQSPSAQELGQGLLRDGMLIWHATQPETQQVLGDPELAVRDIVIAAADAGLQSLEYMGMLPLRTFSIEGAPGLMTMRLRTNVQHLRLDGCDVLRAVTSEDHYANVVSVLRSCAALSDVTNRTSVGQLLRPRSFLAIDVPCDTLNLTQVAVKRLRVFQHCIQRVKLSDCVPMPRLKSDPMMQVFSQGEELGIRGQAVSNNDCATPLGSALDQGDEVVAINKEVTQPVQLQGGAAADSGGALVPLDPAIQTEQNLQEGAEQPIIEYLPLCRHWVLKILLDQGRHDSMLHQTHCSDPEVLLFAGVPAESLNHSKFDAPSVLGQLWQLHTSATGNAAGWPESGAGSANLASLRSRLGLSELQTQIVGLCALSELNPPLRRALASLGRLDFLKQAKLLGLLLGASTREVEQALSLSGPLVGSCLLDVNRGDEDLMHVNMRLMPGMADQLFVSVGPDFEEIFSSSFKRVEPPCLHLSAFEHLQPQLGHAVAYLRDSLVNGSSGINLLIRGTPEAGKTAIARVIAQELGAEVFEITLPQAPLDRTSAELRLSAYRIAQSVLARRPQTLIVFDGIEDLDQALVDQSEGAFVSNSRGKLSLSGLERLLKTNPVPAIWVSARVRHLEREALRHFGFHLHLDGMPESVRSRLAQSNALRLGLTAKWLETKALNPAVSPQLMSNASVTAQAILRQEPGAKPDEVMDGLLEASLKTLGNKRPADWQHGPIAFDAALISTKVDVPRVVESLRASPAARLVFFGPPGTGKSQLARYIARAIGRPALVKRSSDLIGAYVGESERAVADAFEEARRTDAVLILDEADGFFQRRETAVRSYEVSLVNEFLQQVESFDKGVLVATTNALARMDEASLRRFDLKLEFSFLNSGQAMELMQRCCKQLGVYEPGCERLITSVQRLAPGDFATVVRQARFRPVLSADDVLQRLHEEVSFKDGPRQAIGFGMVL